jgi:O-acetyl-ADP-ribose deacetylase (regulator of RNase III)
MEILRRFIVVKYRVGDLILAAIDPRNKGVVIGHCANCFNTMKSGIAPLIAAAFPEAHVADQLTKKGDRGKLGSFTAANSVNNGVLVYNLYGQFGYWNRQKGLMDLQYAELDKSLSAMAGNLHSRCRITDTSPKEVKIFLPKIGSGLAGGDWTIIEPMIDKHLGGFDVTIFTLK